MSAPKVRHQTWLCLCVIIKEDPHTMRNAMANLPHNVKAIAILDTGSPQETLDYLNEEMIRREIPGEIITRIVPNDEFHFGKARTEAIRHAENVVYRVEQGLLGPGGKELKDDPTHPRHHIGLMRRDIPKRLLTREEYAYYKPDQVMEGSDFLASALQIHTNYTLTRNWYYYITDADNFTLDKGVNRRNPKPTTIPGRLTLDSYCIATSQSEDGGGNVYSSVSCIRVNPEKRWRWRHGRHEYPQALFDRNLFIKEYLPGIWMYSGRTGLRSQNAVKFLNDVIYFERKIAKKPKDGRSLYYRAQSWNDCGPWYREMAYKSYIACASTPGFREEIYMAWMAAAKIARALYPGEKGDFLYYKHMVSARSVPTMEDQWDAPFFLMRLAIDNGGFHHAWDIGKSLVDTKPRDRALHMDQGLNSYRFYWLCAVSAWRSGDFVNGDRLYQMALISPFLPEKERGEIKKELDSMIAAQKKLTDEEEERKKKAAEPPKK